MNQDQSSQSTGQQAEALAKMGVGLPWSEWEQLGSLQFIGASGAEFERVKEQVQGRKERLEALLGGHAAELSLAIGEDGAALRAGLEKPGAQSEPSKSDVASGQAARERKRMEFLWGTSHLLEGFGEALQKGVSDEDGESIRKGVRNILAHAVLALSESEDDSDVTVELPSCNTCYSTFLKCTLPPATCQANYAYCTTHCV